MLDVADLQASYGPTRVLHGVTFSLGAGDALAVLGRNGAGKTTLLKAIMGLVSVDAGSISLDGRGDITSVPVHKRAELGIGYVPQGRRLFARLTVEENLAMGASWARKRGDSVLDEIYAAFPKLAERRTQKAGTLSGGEQQMVAFGRAIAMRPSLLLLDEPSEGLAPVVVDTLIDSVVSLSRTLGFAILIVEQNVSAAFEAAGEAMVMERGAIVRRAPSAELRDDPDLQRALAI